MSQRTNRLEGGKKKKNYGGKGGGMHRHAKSGVAHNHRNTIERVREYNAEQERIAQIKRRQKGELYSSVRELFDKA